jgi:tetratricopeptide (TPR) repeat protein
MQKYLLVFFYFFIFTFSATAQNKTDYRQKFTEGNYLILEGNYSLALKNFLEAYEIDSSNSNINFKVGLCYLKSETEKSKALSFLEKAVLKTSKNYNDIEPTEKDAPVNAFYYYGQALHFNYKFDEAIANYEKFKSFLKDKNADLIKDVDRQIEISNNAKYFVAAPINIILKNLGDSINTQYPEYSPVLSADEKTILFTSRRPDSNGGDKADDGLFYEDIYISYKKSDSTWTSPVSVSSNINTPTHEATVGLTADAQTLLMYKDSNGGDIWYSTLDGNNWTFPAPMGSDINSSKWETSACLSPDGNTLYFVSDREGGLGGRDIWKCVKLPNGQWAKAQNVGAPVNTPYDEESPFIHPGGSVLFFSSNGHKTMGGFDIFFSTKNEETNGWDEPQNIGYPINTTDDDVFYVTSPDGKRGYYSSSSRPEGYGGKDIYMVSLPERKEVPLVLIKGFIIPVEGQQLPPFLEISVTNNETGVVAGVYKPMMRDGSFTIIIPPGSNYTLSYTNDGQEFFSEVIDVPMSAAYKEINREVRLKGVNFGTPTHKDSTATSDVSFISVDGKIFDTKDTPYANLKVNLLNSKGEIVKTTTTDELGWFIFTDLPQNDDYVVALDETDTHVIGKKSYAEFKDNKGNILKSKNLGGRFQLASSKTSVKFKNNPKQTTIGSDNVVKDNTPIHHEQLANVDKLNFQMFFKYNVTEIDVNDGPFKQYIENLVALAAKNGSININLSSCASQVPTRAFKTNKELSIARSDKAKEQILNALKDKGIDDSKITFVKVKSFVSGPVYNIDYLINKALYEKYQYIKISAF